MKREIITNTGGRKLRSATEANQWHTQEPPRATTPTAVLSSMPSWTRYIDSRMKQFAAGR